MAVWWSYPTTFLSGAAAAGAVGLINSVGNLGGFVGPYLTGWVKQATGSFAGAMLYLAVSLVAAACSSSRSGRRLRNPGPDLTAFEKGASKSRLLRR